jgi:hypothetical protein
MAAASPAGPAPTTSTSYGIASLSEPSSSDSSEVSSVEKGRRREEGEAPSREAAERSEEEVSRDSMAGGRGFSKVRLLRAG